MRRTGTIVVSLFLVGLLGVGAWSFGNGAKESPYITGRVQRGDIIQVVSATGTLQAGVTVQVGSQVSGTIAKLHTDFNSQVKKGQVIAELDQAKFKARVDEEKASLRAAQANMAKTKVTLEDTRRNLA